MVIGRSAEASNARLHANQMHYVTSYRAAEQFNCEHVHEIAQGARGSSGFCATQRRILSTFDAEWQRYVYLIFVRTSLTGCSLFDNHRTSLSTVVDPPSWSDASDSLGSMSDSEEDEDDIPDDKDPSCPGVDEVW